MKRETHIVASEKQRGAGLSQGGELARVLRSELADAVHRAVDAVRHRVTELVRRHLVGLRQLLLAHCSEQTRVREKQQHRSR